MTVAVIFPRRFFFENVGCIFRYRFMWGESRWKFGVIVCVPTDITDRNVVYNVYIHPSLVVMDRGQIQDFWKGVRTPLDPLCESVPENFLYNPPFIFLLNFFHVPISRYELHAVITKSRYNELTVKSPYNGPSIQWTSLYNGLVRKFRFQIMYCMSLWRSRVIMDSRYNGLYS